jgi:hypothetical protein
MTQMQPDAPEDSLVDNEGVNAGSGQDQLAGGEPAGDPLGGGRPGDFDPRGGPGDETQQAGELAGAPGSLDTDTGQDLGEPGQDAGSMDGT